jgi:hypothetical protein
MNGQTNAGQAYASQALGLGLGNIIGNTTNPNMGGNTVLDRIAAQNGAILAAQPQQGSAQPQGGAPQGGQQQSTPTDPFAAQISVWRQRAQMFAQNGNYQAAQAATDKANMLMQARVNMANTSSNIDKNAAEESKDYAQGQNAVADSQSKTIQIPVDQEGNYKTMGFNPKTGQYDIFLGIGKKTPTTSVTLNEQHDQLPLYQAAAEELKVQHPQALQTQQNIHNVDAAITQLNKGIISGTASEFRQNLDNVLTTLGFTQGDDLARTRAFLANTNKLAIGLGKGMFSRVTNWEAQLLQGMSGGNVNVAAPALRSILQTVRTASVQGLQQYNTRRDQLSKDKNIGSTIDSLYPRIDIPDDPNAGPSGPAAGLDVGKSTSSNGFTITRIK